MEKLSAFLLLLNVMFASAAREVTVSSGECGSYYDMEEIGEDAYLTYSGGRLNNDECSVQFTNYQTYAKQTCIKPVRITLGCSTTVDVFRHFISEYLDPSKQYTCTKKSYDEWCGPTRTNRVYVVFRTSGSSYSDYIKLHVYLKKLPGSETDSYSYSSSSSSTGAIVGAVLGSFVVITLVGTIIACKVAQQRRQAVPRTPYMVVQASAAPGNASSNQPIQQPYYQPPQQTQFQPGLQGYQLHPMQSAFPASTDQRQNMGTGYQPSPHADLGHHSPAGFHQPSAPPVNNADLPPSYESVLK